MKKSKTVHKKEHRDNKPVLIKPSITESEYYEALDVHQYYQAASYLNTEMWGKLNK